MNINLELYKTFCTVASIGSITKSAEFLLISQPAITKSIHNLEEQLGVQLFIRTKHGVCLTEEGEVLYTNLKQGMDAITNAENSFYELKNLKTGKIKIGASSTLTKYFLMPYIEQFYNLYPNIDIQIVNGLTKDLFNELRNGNIDMVILNLPTDYEKDIKIISCKEVHDTFFVGSKYIKEIPKSIKVNELNNYPLILQKSPSNTRLFIDNFMIENKVILKPKIEVVSYDLVFEFTKIGLGIGYGTKDFMKKDLEAGTLIEIKIKPEIPSRKIGIAVLNNEYIRFASKEFITLLTEKSEKNENKK